jgi:hypothetical protein
MDKTATLKLLNRFVDYNRNNMNQPFSQQLKIGKYLCATDAKRILLIPETEDCKIENVEGYKPPNLKKKYLLILKISVNYITIFLLLKDL